MAETEDHQELLETGAALARLTENEDLFQLAADAFRKEDADIFRAALEKAGVLDQSYLICRWLWSFHCSLVCRAVCLRWPTRPPKVTELLKFAEGVSELVRDEKSLLSVVEAIEAEDADATDAVLERFGLQPWCYLVCLWICHLRKVLFCRWVRGEIERPDLLKALRETGEVLGRMTVDEQSFIALHEAAEQQDTAQIREILAKLGLDWHCRIVCRWLCWFHCIRVCLRICRPVDLPDWPQLREYAVLTSTLTADRDAVVTLAAAVNQADADTVHRILERYKLLLACRPICLWLCHWHCRLLCRLVCPDPGPLPVFRKIGGIIYQTQVDSGPAGNGLTLADKRAFYSTLRLNGVLYQKLFGQPMEYRFEVREPGGGWVPVKPDQIARTVIGTWTRFTGILMDPVESKDYTVNGTPGPDEVTIFPDADGWIKVPQEDNFWGGAGLFTSNGNQINLMSATLGPLPDIDLTGITAGSSTTPAGLGDDALYGIRMRVRRVGVPASEMGGGTCENAAIYNRRYDEVSKHGSWAPTTVDDQLLPVMLNIDEIAGGCGKITNSLTIRYTAAHPNLGTISLAMTGPGGPFTFALTPDAAASAVDAFGTAALTSPAVTSLAKCAYTVTLSADALLTTGDSVPLPVHDFVSFCM